MNLKESFFNIGNHGFVRVAAAVPKVSVADTEFNVANMSRLAKEADDRGVQLLVFPELGITGYACGDLFNQLDIQRRALADLFIYITVTASLDMVSVVGLPLVCDDQLFNVAAVCHKGKILAFIPKTYIPGYNIFYEPRWFAPASRLRSKEICLNGEIIPIGTDIIINMTDIPGFRLAVEICEDLWMPTPPSSSACLAGATIIANLSASPELVGRAEYRRNLVSQQSARCIAGYIYTSCGPTESTSEVVFGGHALIAENGAIMKESKTYCRDSQMIVSDIDTEILVRERSMTGSFGQAIGANGFQYRQIYCSGLGKKNHGLYRRVEKSPFVPGDPDTLDARCEEVFSIQTSGLAGRLKYVESVIDRKTAIGISGGLDSTLALLALIKTYDMLGWNRKDIIAVTMPGFGTSSRTRENAISLINELGLTMREIPIVDAVIEHLKDIGHEPDLCCIVCENAQARERTQILMDLGFVIGTGDLSEIALGWCTYNGDQMSMYNPNCGVPKTLVRFIVDWVAKKNLFGDKASAILKDILNTPISPELISVEKAGTAQQTEDIIGPYRLHDFFLFNMARYGFTPDKILFLASRAFPEDSIEAIAKWLKLFYKRFYANQFKRDASPNGPKIGSVDLSPRASWRMASDIRLNDEQIPSLKLLE